MARGNQRDLARAKNQKKQQEMNKGRKDDGMTHQQRQERDADIMRQKAEKKKQEEADKQKADLASGQKKDKVTKSKGIGSYFIICFESVLAYFQA